MEKKTGYKVFNIINILVSIAMMVLIAKSYVDIGKIDGFSEFMGSILLLLFAGVLNWSLVSIIFSFIYIKNNFSKPETRTNEIAFYIVVACLTIPSFFMLEFLMFIFGWGQKDIFNNNISFASPVTIMYIISIGVSVLKLVIDLILIKNKNNSVTVK
ncbi:MAG: hypothetical protein IKF36_06370 [Bacilli bacterium]|nr:hypothetical protein [Bacilli bacterium]